MQHDTKQKDPNLIVISSGLALSIYSICLDLGKRNIFHSQNVKRCTAEIVIKEV